MKKILIVDDEIQILKSLARAFFETDYEIYTAETGLDALAILDDIEINLIISDMRMPLMDGYELLSRVKEKYPNVVRIILSGYAEELTVFKAILHNVAKFYIIKPWSNEKLLEYVRQIFETEDILKSKELLSMINNLEGLPTIEASHQKILNMIENDEDMGKISVEIEKDFSISTKLLQIANSAFYGVQTGSVKQAAVYLGIQNLKSLIYSTSILNKFSSSSQQEQQYIKDLWTHALLTNNILHYIYNYHMGKRISEAASSAGLLHNVGALVLMENHFFDYPSMIGEARKNKLNLLEMERNEFNLTHQEAGGFLIGWWELPFPIIEAALFHHRPLDPAIINREIVAAVHIAQHFAWIKLGMQIVVDFFPEAFDILGLSQQVFEESLTNQLK